MKNILMLATGGTIACEPSADGLVPKLSGEKMLTMIPALKNICNITCLELMNLDSSNICPDNWLLMAKTIYESYDKYDGFVITHGTDTMAYTAAALSHLLINLDKPVILTGAQKPLQATPTDAAQNIIDSFITAADKIPGVFLVFNGNIHKGSVVKKVYSENFAGFASINEQPAGTIVQNSINWLSSYSTISTVNPPLKLIDKLEEKIYILKLIPGLKPDILDILVEHDYKAIIIEGYGAGGVPTDKAINNFLPAIKRAIAKNVSVVCTTQCLYDGVHLDKYPIGILAARLGAISGTTLTTEELTIRLMVILAQTSDNKLIKEYVEQIL